VAELLPGITEAILERNPQLIGSGPLIALNVPYDNGRAEKMALPPSPPLLAEAGDALADDFDEFDDLDMHDGELDDDALAATPAISVAETQTETIPADATPAPANGVAGEAAAVATTTLIAAPVEDAPRPARWKYEPPEADDAILVETHAAAVEPVVAAPAANGEFFSDDEEPPPPSDDEPAHATSSFDAALESLRFRMDRSKLPVTFIRDLLVPDAVLDVSETALRWAGMPNKHERSLTSEIFFALAEWGFLAPRADGRYRVVRTADDTAPL
jgi:hypothetical protein